MEEKNIFKKFIYVIKTILLAATLWFITFALYENIMIEIELNNFISRGVKCDELSSDRRIIYRVPRETSNELRSLEVNGEPRPGLTGDIKGSIWNFHPGYKGDIFVHFDTPVNIPIVRGLINFFAGGHASLVAMSWSDWQRTIREDHVIDVSGMHKDDNDVVTVEGSHIWMDSTNWSNVIGLRVISNKLQRTIAVNEAISFIGDPYNHSFILNTYGRHYCTDKISKAYDVAGINLNHDGFATTVHDLFVSHNTYIFMYRRTDRFGVDHIWLLCDTIPQNEEEV